MYIKKKEKKNYQFVFFFGFKFNNREKPAIKILIWGLMNPVVNRERERDLYKIGKFEV